jgi:hypothetical protein
MTYEFERMADAGYVRRHLAYLRLAGMTWAEIGAQAGMGRQQVHDIYKRSQSSVTYRIATRLLAVRVPERQDDWMDRAECKASWVQRTAEEMGLSHPNEIFIPRRDPGEKGRTPVVFTLLARRICSMCEVRAECLEYALDGDESGTWGGHTESERNAMRRKDN